MKHPVPYVSFEVNLPDFRTEGLECIKVLESLSTTGEFNYAADLRRGFALEHWLGPREFSSVLRHCTEESIEVFWKSGMVSKAGNGSQSSVRRTSSKCHWLSDSE